MLNLAAKALQIIPFDKIDFSKIFNGIKSTLTRYIERNNKPSDIDLRSPLFKRLSRAEAIGVLDKVIFDSELGFDYAYFPPELSSNESSAKRKTTSKSRRHSYERRLPKMLPYFKDESVCIINRENRRILEKFVLPRVKRLLDKGRLRSLSPRNATMAIKMNTQWGLPFLQRGAICFEQHLNLVNEAIRTGDFSYILNLPCLLGWRGQPGVGDTAQRIVWMYPHSMSIIDCMIVKPLMSALSGKKQFCMLESEFKCSGYITKILSKSRYSNYPTLGFDASAFDSSILRYVIVLAFIAIKYWFQEKDLKIIEVCEEYLMESSLLGLELLIGRTSSMPSGSGFTNILDTLIQYIYFLYTAFFMKRSIEYNTFIDECEFTGMGDDGVWYIPNLTIKSLTKILSTLNVKCEPTKQSFSTNYVSFCQNIYSLGWVDDFGKCKGSRSVFRTFNSMISMERFRKGFTAKYHTIRWIVQLEDAFDSPYFPHLLSVVLNEDKFKLGLSEPGRVNSLFRDVGGLSGFFNVLGDNFRYQKITRGNSSYDKLRIFKLLDILPKLEVYTPQYLANFISQNKNNLIRREYFGINNQSVTDYNISFNKSYSSPT